MKRFMGLDVGDKTIGVAISDPFFLTAQGLYTIKRIGIKKDMKELLDLIEKYEIIRIVIGLPKNMDNSIGPQSEKVLDFAELIMEVDTENVLPMEMVQEEKAVFREDIPEESLDRETALQNAKDREYGYFRLKKVID